MTYELKAVVLGEHWRKGLHLPGLEAAGRGDDSKNIEFCK